MKFYIKAIAYAARNIGKVPEEDLMNRLTIARLMDQFVDSLKQVRR